MRRLKMKISNLIQTLNCPYGLEGVIVTETSTHALIGKCMLADEARRLYRWAGRHERYLASLGCPRPYGRSYSIRRPDCKYNDGRLKRV